MNNTKLVSLTDLYKQKNIINKETILHEAVYVITNMMEQGIEFDKTSQLVKDVLAFITCEDYKTQRMCKLLKAHEIITGDISIDLLNDYWCDAINKGVVYIQKSYKGDRVFIEKKANNITIHDDIDEFDIKNINKLKLKKHCVVDVIVSEDQKNIHILDILKYNNEILLHDSFDNRMNVIKKNFDCEVLKKSETIRLINKDHFLEKAAEFKDGFFLKKANSLYTNKESTKNWIEYQPIYKRKSKKKESLQKRKPIEKRKLQKIEQNLFYWGHKKNIIDGLRSKIDHIATTNKIKKSFVSIESLEVRVLKYLEENFKIENAIYRDLLDKDNSTKYKSFIIKSKEIDIVLSEWDLYVFFNNKEEFEKVFAEPVNSKGQQILNYKPGAYSIKLEMTFNGMQHVLSPIDISNVIEPIFDDGIEDNLKKDTNLFFENREFYLKNDLPHKRGVLLYGPPGMGKTTFINNYLYKNQDRFGITIDCRKVNVDDELYKFLEKTLHNQEKILVFEDVDSVTDSYDRRSSFLNFLDGQNQLDNTLIIATTNYPRRLDDAIIKRPSRFDRLYKIDYPGFESRKKFISKFYPHIKGSLLDKYATQTEGFSGSHFKELFILQNIQQSKIFQAIDQLKTQMGLIESDIYKSLKNADDLKEKTVELFKAKTEERIVVGVILKPNDTDAQGHIYNNKTVVDAADFYMENFQNIGLMHEQIINNKVKILQSYTSPIDFKMKNVNGVERTIEKDTWLMKFRVLDDDIWKKVKSGELTGFSIGGTGTIRRLKKLLNDIKKRNKNST